MLVPSDSVQKGLYMCHQKNHEYSFCEVINIILASLLLLPISFFYVYLFIFLSIGGYRSSSRIISEPSIADFKPNLFTTNTKII